MKRALVLAVVMLAGCGGAATQATSPSSGAGGSGAAAPEMSPSHSSTQSPDVPVTDSRRELDRAEQQLGSAPGDCAAACKALASMDRAASHICALDSGSECGSARERVEAARRRVQTSCGGCST